MIVPSLPPPKLIPWAKGSAREWLMVQVLRRMYCFQASLPDSRPPPVSFSPPKAPPFFFFFVGVGWGG